MPEAFDLYVDRSAAEAEQRIHQVRKNDSVTGCGRRIDDPDLLFIGENVGGLHASPCPACEEAMR